MAVEALQPLVDDGRADRVSCSVIRSSRSAVGMQTHITVGEKAPEILNLESIGV
jgi:phage gp46-like protein